jgi:hypothetical protein
MLDMTNYMNTYEHHTGHILQLKYVPDSYNPDNRLGDLQTSNVKENKTIQFRWPSSQAWFCQLVCETTCCTCCRFATRLLIPVFRPTMMVQKLTDFLT